MSLPVIGAIISAILLVANLAGWISVSIWVILAPFLASIVIAVLIWILFLIFAVWISKN